MKSEIKSLKRNDLYVQGDAFSMRTNYDLLPSKAALLFFSRK